jgi:hypothetical protein
MYLNFTGSEIHCIFPFATLSINTTGCYGSQQVSFVATMYDQYRMWTVYDLKFQHRTGFELSITMKSNETLLTIPIIEVSMEHHLEITALQKSHSINLTQMYICMCICLTQ